MQSENDRIYRLPYGSLGITFVTHSGKKIEELFVNIPLDLLCFFLSLSCQLDEALKYNGYNFSNSLQEFGGFKRILASSTPKSR